MPASSSNPHLQSTIHGSSHERKWSEADRFTEDIRDAQSGEAADREPPSMSRENGNTQSSEARDATEASIYATDFSSVTMFEGASNFHMVNTNITPIYDDATIIRFGGERLISHQKPSTLPSPPFVSESPSMSRENGDTQSREARDATEPSILATDFPSVTAFQRPSNFQISNTNINVIGGNATVIRFGDGHFTEVQRSLIFDYIANLSVLPGIVNILRPHALTHSVISLPRAEAVFNDYQNKKKSGPCFDGTRVALLREMANWATGPDESRIYVLSGLAGIGKSTVAYTIASRMADLNLLGASFFFSRDDTDCNNAKKFFTTIAYQLCVYNKRFAKAIGDALLTERGSAATTKDPQEQLQALILEPLRSIVQSSDRPILVVVDALDECDESGERAIVKGLSQLIQELPHFKVILTTRPQPSLIPVFGSQGGHKIFRLQDIEDKVVDGDIRLYLNYSLSLEQVQEHCPKCQWCASDEQIDPFVRAAGRFFIIASTAVRYILDKSASNPAAQMQKLLRAFVRVRMPFNDLDEFYPILLWNIVPADRDDDDIIKRCHAVVGAIISVPHPLPVTELAGHINVEAEEIHVVLNSLRSVVMLDNDDIPRIYHQSFSDYIRRCHYFNMNFGRDVFALAAIIGFLMAILTHQR